MARLIGLKETRARFSNGRMTGQRFNRDQERTYERNPSGRQGDFTGIGRREEDRGGRRYDTGGANRRNGDVRRARVKTKFSEWPYRSTEHYS
jgi:hypothetical protein